jgi:hypothetical protein
MFFSHGGTRGRGVRIQAQQGWCFSDGSPGSGDPGHRHARCSIRSRTLLNRLLFAHWRRFSAGTRSVQKTRHHQARIPLEPKTRNGLSLARNDAFATITRSMLLPCSFAFTLETPRESVRSRLLRSVRFRGRNRASSTPLTRYSLRSPALLRGCLSPLPFRPFQPITRKSAPDRLPGRPGPMAAMDTGLRRQDERGRTRTGLHVKRIPCARGNP